MRWLRIILARPGLWQLLALFLAGYAGVAWAEGDIVIGAICFSLALAAGERVTRLAVRLRSRVRYIISAAMNGDFSYKFPVEDVPEHERDINIALNRLVAHLEVLSHDASQNERFLSVVINLVDTGIVVADAQGHVLQHNRAALALMGLPVITNVCQMPVGDSSLSIRKTEAKLHGQALCIYTINDMSRLLQKTEVESWEKLTRVLTHEIMNSLTPINSIAGSLASGSSAEDMASSLEVISSSTNALMEFVKNFRKFTILPEPQPKVFYIKPFLERAVALASNYAGAEGIEFSLKVFPADAMAYADESMLQQVVVNILKNAVEAGPKGIWVEAKIRTDESVEISISNDGAPIPPHIADQIFTPFYTTKPGGSGIGLSLSRRIIARLGGTLTLAGQGGRGAKFIIVL